MTNFKKTKRALLGSAMALFICFAMLVGTTFAWFTDSATSSGNIIKTGTLDVGMYWAEGTEVVPNNDADWTDASVGAIFNHDKWEPGYVEVRHIKISNEGTLALKYQISIVANGTVSDLADAIDVYYVDPAAQIADRADLNDNNKIGTLTEVLAGMQTTAGGELAADEDHTVTLALKMRENAENKYQGKSLGSSFSVVLLATQLAAETDAFDNKYDENAEYPEVEISNTQKQEGVVGAVETPDEAVKVEVPAGAPAGSYDLEVSDKSVNTDANGNTTVSMDIELKYNGGEADDQYAYTVSVNVGAGLNITKVVHDGAEIPATDYTYNPVTGVITFTTNSFSPFSFTYNNEATSVSTFEELKAAVANGGLITLAADVKASETLVVTKGTVIDGNGFKLTSSAGRAINVSGADGVVIKNLVIECTGERAINVIQNATNVVVDTVTATAANYTVNVASSAPGAIVTVKNSTLNGLCTVNVSAANAEVSVIDSTVNCNDNNTTAGEGYAALSLNMEAMGAKIIATGSTINVVEGSDSVKGRNGAESGVVTIDGSTDEVLVTVAAITYSGSPYYYTFTSLAEAIEFASAGDTVSLIRDVELRENTNITIGNGVKITLDLNGHTLSAKNSNTNTHNFMIDVNGGELTVKNGTITLEHVGANMGWNGATSVINVAAGGVLNLDGVTVKNLGGTDMNFAVHMNNWGSVTLNADNCVFDAPYCSVRVFNSGPDMNNVTITNSKMTGATRAFWVHNYVASDMGGKIYSGSSVAYDKAVVDARLNLNIFGNNNTFEITGTAKSPIRYGFDTSVYFDADGNVVE